MSSCRRSRGTTRWMPFDARTLNLPRSPTRSWTSSVQTPVALIDLARAARRSRRPLSVAHPHAGDALALAQEADHRARWRRRPRRTRPPCARRSACGGRRRPGRRSTGCAPTSASASQRRARSSAPRACVRWRWRGRPLCAAQRVVEHQPGADVGRSQPRSVSGSRNGTGRTRCGASALSSSARSRSASRTSPKSRCSR